jgi:MoaA/NifB/PqqE/SkfB family radical SAM enzyme
VVRAIDMCVAAGMRTAVNTTINRLNQGSLKEMRTFLMEHGAFAWQPQLATASGNMGETVFSPGVRAPR